MFSVVRFLPSFPRTMWYSMQVWLQHPWETKHTPVHTHSCCSSTRTPEQVISWTERAQLWITASNERGSLSEKLGVPTDLAVWQKALVFRPDPPAPVGGWRPRTYQQWRLTGASSRDTSRSANANALSESDCINTQSRYLQHPLWNNQGKKCSSVEFAGRYAFFLFLF